MPESRGQRPRPRTRRAPAPEASPEREAAPERVLLAGASGALGTAVARELGTCGYCVRALVRDPSRLRVDVDEVFAGDLTEPSSLKGACADAAAVISCAGAKAGFVAPGRGRYSYAHVDEQGNSNLLAEAKAAGVRKFIYVSVFGGKFLGPMEYIRAHESFATALKFSGLDYAVIRPTAFFSAYKRVFNAARKGRVTLVGNGAARVNPISDEDLAALCVDMLHGHRQEIEAGGPQTYTRREAGELAFRALGKQPKVRRIPGPLAGSFVRLSCLTGRHNYHIAQFFALASLTDLVAPSHGTRRLEDYFRELATVEAQVRPHAP